MTSIPSSGKCTLNSYYRLKLIDKHVTIKKYHQFHPGMDDGATDLKFVRSKLSNQAYYFETLSDAIFWLNTWFPDEEDVDPEYFRTTGTKSLSR